MNHELYKFLFNQCFGRCLDCLAPQFCRQCQLKRPEIAGLFCNTCFHELPTLSNHCRRCGRAFTANQDYCGRCIQQPPAYDALFCPFEYTDCIAAQIRKLKYNEQPALANKLAELFTYKWLENENSPPEAIIPVPMHLSKLRERGFNQANLLAKAIGHSLKLPVLIDAAHKTHATPPQASLSLKKRHQNVRNSFKLTQPPPFSHVAIVDDVVTTGATATEMTKILKKNGVDYIEVWGLAHAV